MSEEILIAKNFEDPEEQEIEIAAAPLETSSVSETALTEKTFEEEAFDKEVEFDTFIDRHKESSDTIFIEATK